jgi:hypothetical protein
LGILKRETAIVPIEPKKVKHLATPTLVVRHESLIGYDEQIFSWQHGLPMLHEPTVPSVIMGEIR